ncbi:hypothetical protein EDB84DRAFT_1281151 [Lactarius hengduanensis]|nr:hypothetical protein EDB84DRAFT_1281151 [Lactarius hengduanensis]
MDTQQRLDPHLEEKPPRESVIPYMDKLFCEAAVEWLVLTDQPIQAFNHPLFQKMIHTAAQASSVSGVKIPDGHQTRQAIIDTFKMQLPALCKRLTVH